MEETKPGEPENIAFSNDLYIVGIGASAGGYEAIETFFKNMPEDTGMAFVIIQHLSPDFKSLMVELLSKHTKMKVYRVEDGMQIRPNCVYLIPPRKTMTIFQEQLFLSEIEKDLGINLPINLFFRSLSNNSGEKAIGIILSGTGSDGTLGIRDIKGQGGMVMVQDDTSAKFDGMPKSAISTGLVDFIAKPEEMPEILVKFINHLTFSDSETDKNPKNVKIDKLAKLMSIILKTKDMDFTHYKSTTILRRVEKRMGICQIKSVDEYIELLEKSNVEVATLVDELLINVTNFFRDPETFEYLKKKIIPKIFSNRKVNVPLRVWAVGCSTGEEAYSLAILFREYMEETGENAEIKIFATDIDNTSLVAATAGLYTDNIAVDVSSERLSKYFIRKENSYQIIESIRKMVIFAFQNIIKDPPFNKIDLITCRNLLIYLETTAQKRALSYIHFALNPMGFLLLGKSETIGQMLSHFRPLDNRLKFYQKIGKNTLSLEMREDLFRNVSPALNPLGLEVRSASSREKSYEDVIYHTLMEKFEPSALLVNGNNNIEYIFGDAEKYIRMNRGKINLTISKNLRLELSTAISTGLHKSKKTGKEVIYNDIIIKDDDKITNLNLTIQPFTTKDLNSDNFFIIFEEVSMKPSIKSEGEVYDPSIHSSLRIKELETDLQITRENLQATVEELETSNEELQATNEELLASNEELQSTNEELQSVNEELITVNAEYLQKLEDLIQITNDFDNLLNSTQIATLFLDLDFRIRKFTPNIRKFFNISKIDIGRNISNFSYNMEFHDLLQVLSNVSQKGNVVEREIQVENNQHFIMRILQFMASDNVIEGIVITFVDISVRKIAEANLARSEERFRSAFEYSGIGMAILSYYGEFLKVNSKMIDLLDYSDIEFLKMTIFKISHDEFQMNLRANLEELAEGKTDYFEMKIRVLHKENYYLWVVLSFSIVRTEDKTAQYFIVQVRDVTDREKAIADLKETSILLEELHQLARIGGWVFQIQEDEMVWTEITREIYEVDASYKPSLEDMYHEADYITKDLLKKEFNKCIFKHKKISQDIRVRSFRGNDLFIRIIAKPEMIDGNVVKIIGTVQDFSNAFKKNHIQSSHEEMIENYAEPAILIQKSGKIAAWNSKAEKSLGYSQREVIGKSIYSLIPESALKNEKEIVKRLLKGESILPSSTLRKHKFGKEMKYDQILIPLQNNKGVIDSFISILKT